MNFDTIGHGFSGKTFREVINRYFMQGEGVSGMYERSVHHWTLLPGLIQLKICTKVFMD